MSVTIALRKEDIGPWLLRFRERVSPRLLAKAARGALYQTVVKHMDEDVSRRHATAARLGATPTKHWENPEAYIHLKAGGDASEVSITRPGIARAVCDVTIRPRNAKALTIPISALSYGKRPLRAHRAHAPDLRVQRYRRQRPTPTLSLPPRVRKPHGLPQRLQRHPLQRTPRN